jgi:cytochrome c oxidase cbb3-type subunit 3
MVIDIRMIPTLSQITKRVNRNASLAFMHKMFLITILAFTLHLSAQIDAAKNEIVQRGKAKFEQSCAMCHGREALGGAGPNLIQSSLTRHDENGNLIGPVIQDGRLDKGMPAFPSMSSADISNIVAFLHARIDSASISSSNGLAEGYSLQQLLTGNPVAGKQYFNGPGKCVNCHSVRHDLAGIASKYSPADLEAKFLYPPNDDITATISLPSGRQFRGKLLHLDAFYVAIRNNQDGWYRSWPLKQMKVAVHDPLAGHLELLGQYTDKDIHDLFAYLETLK